MIEILNKKEDEFQSIEVYTADNTQIIAGLILLIGSIIIESVLIFGYLPFKNTVLAILFFFFHIFSIGVFYWSILLFKMYKRRSKFTVYRAKMEDGIQIQYIKDNFHIINYNLDYITFMKKCDNYEQLYDDWFWSSKTLNWNS